MRLIDADALKAYIDMQEGRPFIGCTIGEAFKIMTDEQPTVQPEPHWIPCSEELPTKSDTYRVSANDKSVFDLYYSVEHGWDGWWNGRISAWMPLPEPYKGVTE